MNLSALFKNFVKLVINGFSRKKLRKKMTTSTDARFRLLQELWAQLHKNSSFRETFIFHSCHDFASLIFAKVISMNSAPDVTFCMRYRARHRALDASELYHLQSNHDSEVCNMDSYFSRMKKLFLLLLAYVCTNAFASLKRIISTTKSVLESGL